MGEGSQLALDLFSAADTDDICAAVALLESGVNINICDSDGRTALHRAAAKGSTKVVQELLERGAKFETQDDGAWSPLHSAASAGRIGVVAELIEASANLEKGAGSSGSTAIILASSKGHDAVVQALLNSKAGPFAVDASGATALHRAAGNGHVVVIETLLKAVPSMIDTRDKTGHTAFHLAALHLQDAACFALAEAGANLDTENVEGEKPTLLLKPNLRSLLGLLVSHEEDYKVRLESNCPTHVGR